MNNTFKIIRNFVATIASKELKLKFWSWLVYPSMQKEKEEALLDIWNTQQFEADKSTYEAFCKFKKSIRKNKSHLVISIHRKIIRIAAIILIPLLGMATVYYYLNTKTTDIEILECIAPEGETRELILPDGSKVILNSGTVLVYPSKFTETARTVYLSGEGYFNVTKKNTQSVYCENTTSEYTSLRNQLQLAGIPSKLKNDDYSRDRSRKSRKDG